LRDPSIEFIEAHGRNIAYQKIAGIGPGIIFLGGFKSDMFGIKARTLENWCRENKRAFIRFDYSGHGISSGKFEDGTIGQWLQDTLSVIDKLTSCPQVLVGSSMGGWMMLLAGLRRSEKIAGMMGIATAADFTESLVRSFLTPAQRDTLEREGYVIRDSDYQDEPFIITNRLIEDGRKHLLLNEPISFNGPVRMLHGLEDNDVPWTISLEVCKCLTSRDVNLHLIKDAEHRFSRQQDLDLILLTLEQLLDTIRSNGSSQ
jgi:pimeloyl-ACP methyl ester carboxylesterase